MVALLLLDEVVYCGAKKPLASSRHVTWWIKGAKIRLSFMELFLYGIFRIKKKVTMPRVAEYLVGMCSFEYP